MNSASPSGPSVGSLMGSPLVTCAPDVPLREVAALMAAHAIHAVVVRPDPWTAHPDRWGVISDLDLMSAIPAGADETPAGRIAGGPVVLVSPGEPPERAAEIMAAHQVTHVLVADPDGAPVGIVSALDIAAALAPPAPIAPQAAASGSGLRAAPGDRLVIRGHHLGEPDRDAEILEARGVEGGPPFRVRWSDDGRESLFYPGSDAHVDHLEP